MALIKCSGCGHMVSDKGKKCPKCGTPIHKVEEATKPIEEKEKVIVEVENPKVEIPKVDKPITESPKDDSSISESPKEEVETPIGEYEDEPQRQTWKKVCGFIIFIAIVIGGIYLYVDKQNKAQIEKETMLKAKADSAMVADSLARVAAAEQVLDDDKGDGAYLPIKDILAMKRSGKGANSKEILKANGYEQAESDGDVSWWIKNANVVGQNEVGHGGGYTTVEPIIKPTKKANGEDDGSIVEISCDTNDNITLLHIEVFDVKSFLQWKKQFEEIGFEVEYDERSYDEIMANPYDEAETKKRQKDGWSISSERHEGTWVNAMYFAKGEDEMTIIDEGNNHFIIAILF